MTIHFHETVPSGVRGRLGQCSGINLPESCWGNTTVDKLSQEARTLGSNEANHGRLW